MTNIPIIIDGWLPGWGVYLAANCYNIGVQTSDISTVGDLQTVIMGYNPCDYDDMCHLPKSPAPCQHKFTCLGGARW